MRTDATNVLNALLDGALVVDKAGMVTVANRVAIDLLQLNPQGLPIVSILRAPVFSQSLAGARQSGLPKIAELELRNSLSRQISVQISSVGGDGDMLILMRDFTREQAVEKMRSDFVANASHEMRTPLASIIGSIETLQGAAKDDKIAREKFLATMLVQGQRMKRLIDDLLTLSKIELNEHVKPNALVSLNDIARQAKDSLTDSAEKAGIAITMMKGERVEVAGDADELLQVAQNLIENALKYGGGGGRVEIECFSHAGYGNLAVRDFGRGIAEIHLPRLTERFYRVSTQESRSRGGTGLGLAIVKHIVLRHRGKLSISSKEGQGSTFTIAIPSENHRLKSS